MEVNIENGQISEIFHLLWSPFWPILVQKNASIFCQKLPIWKAHHTFLESRLPEVTKVLA